MAATRWPHPPAHRHLTLETVHRDGWVGISFPTRLGLPSEPNGHFPAVLTPPRKTGLGWAADLPLHRQRPTTAAMGGTECGHPSRHHFTSELPAPGERENVSATGGTVFLVDDEPGC